MKGSRGRGRGKGERIIAEKQLSQKELRDKRATERHKKMIESRTTPGGSGVNLGPTGEAEDTTGLQTGSRVASVSQPSTVVVPNMDLIRDDISIGSSDSGPLEGFSSSRDAIFRPNTAQNSDTTQGNDPEPFARELSEFNTKLQDDENLKLTSLAKTWKLNLRRILNIKKEFDKTRNKSNIAHNKVISETTTNDEAKYYIEIVEEEINEAENAKIKIKILLATKLLTSKKPIWRRKGRQNYKLTDSRRATQPVAHQNSSSQVRARRSLQC